MRANQLVDVIEGLL